MRIERRAVRRWSYLLAAALLSFGVSILQAADQYGPVKDSETLWRIATALQKDHPEASTAQIAWALYQANRDSFDGSPDAVKPGSTLAIPSVEEMTAVDAKLAYDYVSGKQKPPPVAAQKPATVPKPMSADDPLAAMVLNPELAATTEVPTALPTDPATSAPNAPSLKFRDTELGKRMMVLVQTGADPRRVLNALEPLENQWAGDSDFDYGLGTAKLDLGRPSEAIYVLNRAVRIRPGFAGARMALARAYFEIGDNESARREFNQLKAQNPPPAASRAIASYLDAIEQKSAAYAPRKEAFAELGAGYDSNANGATDTQNFLGFTLNSQNRATESGYYGLFAGGLLSTPLSSSWRFVGDAGLNWRAHPDASFVDAQSLRLGAGLEWRRDTLTVRVVPNGSYAMLDGEENHQRYGLDTRVAWARDNGMLSINGRYGSTRYDELVSIQNVDVILLGVASESGWPGVPTLRLSAALTVGQEDAVETGSPFGRDLFGGRAALSFNVTPRQTLVAQVSSLSSDYNGTFFGQSRSDDQVVAGLVWRMRHVVSTGWTLRAQVNWVDNSSNVALYDYDRLEAGLAVRRSFR